MIPKTLVSLVQRGLKKPPHVIARRVVMEARKSWERVSGGRHSQISTRTLLRGTRTTSVNTLWTKLQSRPSLTWLATPTDRAALDEICPVDIDTILQAAEEALAHRVDLLGSGPITLGEQIDWHRDYKTGHVWPATLAHDLDYANLDQPSDVKFAWDVSRLHWLLPTAQAFQLTHDERYAVGAKNVLEQWIVANPCGFGVNWACTMEAALRIFSWTYLFHAFSSSEAWRDEPFRAAFLRMLYAHGQFTERYIEYSDVNGNHCTADAAALVIAGLFFGDGVAPQRWLQFGWTTLCDELPKQVFADGVDFEASVPYHRLVLELFLLPAVYRQRCGLSVPAEYCDRLLAMARFTQAYTRPDGSLPFWGDADDARALPLGTQSLNDHRYLMHLVGVTCDDHELAASANGSVSELTWLCGPDSVSSRKGEAPAEPRRGTTLGSKRGSAGASPSHQGSSIAFPDGGFFVMRSDEDHIFIDCGPVGLAGRGGHGHNDCLSFDAMLAGTHWISDCGAYVYTASPKDRHQFRSSASHNTPIIHGEELNRFVSRIDLWHLKNDAKPLLRRWETGADYDLFVGSHTGYDRLATPARPVRTVVLDRPRHALWLHDAFETTATNIDICTPLHFALGVSVEDSTPNSVTLRSADEQSTLELHWTADGWEFEVGAGRISPSYGVAHPCVRLMWTHRGGPATPLTLGLIPQIAINRDLRFARWSRDIETLLQPVPLARAA
ncbi:MAG TPA: alginate lyase family protein [Planctomycetaceae bacterium]|nr:alginate lyase family protein [Planctomycetaceae bacterium]